MDGMLRALIIKSRVRRTEDCLLVRPSSPALFRLGAAPGPEMLLQRQKGAIATETALNAEWKLRTKKESKETNNKTINWPWSMPLPCRGCSDEEKAKRMDSGKTISLTGICEPHPGCGQNVVGYSSRSASYVPEMCT